MFGEYTEVGHKRDMMGAVFFYLANLVVLVGLSTVLVYFFGSAGVMEGAGNFFDGGRFHTIMGSAFTLWLGGSIIYKRGMSSDVFSILVVAAGVYLAYTSNVMLGMVPIALLTTMGNGK